MHWARLALVVLVAAVLQLVLNKFLDFAFRPDLIIIVMVFFVANTDGVWPIISAFVCGFGADMAFGMAMGSCTIAYGTIGSLLAVARRSIAIDHPIFVAIAVFVVCCVSETLAQILASFRRSTPPGYMDIFWSALASAVVGPYLYSLLSAAGGFLGTRQHPGRRGK